MQRAPEVRWLDHPVLLNRIGKSSGVSSCREGMDRIYRMDKMEMTVMLENPVLVGVFLSPVNPVHPVFIGAVWNTSRRTSGARFWGRRVPVVRSLRSRTTG